MRVQPWQATPDAVHLWRVNLEVADEVRSALLPLLSPQEVRRAGRFLRPLERRRYVVAHAALRQVLGRHLQMEPARVPLAAGPRGKPGLAGGGGLRFNLAHAGGLALIAVTCGREVGVDVEAVRPGRALAALVEQYFSPLEQAEWLSLPAERRTAAFYAGWTQKEAYLKATGEGLWGRTRTFSVRLAGAPGLVASDWGSAEVRRWRFLQFRPAPGYIAAVAAEDGDWQASWWQWNVEGEQASRWAISE